MARVLLMVAAAPMLCIAMPAIAQGAPQSDADYLQHRADTLNARIDKSVRDHRTSLREAKALHLGVKKVEVVVGNYQAHERPIPRADADRLNQSLTDVERKLTHQK